MIRAMSADTPRGLRCVHDSSHQGDIVVTQHRVDRQAGPDVGRRALLHDPGQVADSKIAFAVGAPL